MIPIQKIHVKSNIRSLTVPPPVKVPLCQDCKLYSKDGICRKFAYFSLIDGTERHVAATEARMSFEMCGIGGSCFIKKENSSNIDNE